MLLFSIWGVLGQTKGGRVRSEPVD